MLTSTAVRIAFILWGLSGDYIKPFHGMSDVDFTGGYAIAAGYGYVTGAPWVSARLTDMYQRVTEGTLMAAPGTVEPIDRGDLVPRTIHPPGLALLVAGLHRLLGTSASLPVEILGAVLDTVSAALVWRISASWLGARVAFAAGLCHALFPPFGYWSTVAKSSDGLLGFFIIASLACGLRATQAVGPAAAGWVVAAGALLGVGCYLRPDYLMLPPVVGAAAGLATRRWRRAAIGVVLAQGVAILCLVPWAYRNERETGWWIFTSSSVGGTLVSGLGEFSNSWGIGSTDDDREREAHALGFSDPFQPEADAYFRHVFAQKIRERPGAFLLAIVRRLPLSLATPYTWGLINPWKTETFTEARQTGLDQYDVVLKRPRYVLAAYWDRLAMALVTLACTMGTAAMLVLERHRAADLLLLISPHVYSMAVHLLTHMEPRYLLPSMSLWLIGLAYVIAQGWESKRVDAGRVSRGLGA